MNLKPAFKKYSVPFLAFVVFIVLFILIIILVTLYQKNTLLTNNVKQADSENKIFTEELTNLKKDDQLIINQKLLEEINNIKSTYKKAVIVYEKLLDSKTKIKDSNKLEVLFAQILAQLGETNYSSASSTIAILDKSISEEVQKSLASTIIPESIKKEKTPPSSGYRRQSVSVNGVSFLVDIISADLNNTKVVIDTASDSTCTDNCPVKPLAEYVSRSGAFAGVNGSYFCPDTYPDCASKKNSFDLLVMNKNKVYFNSDNNVYSTNPAAIFSGNSARFVRQTLEWGRDTSVDAVISNYPLLILGNQIVFNGDEMAKHNSKGNRGFIGASGNLVYIGVVHNATVLESAQVLHALGINDALNLDDGGSTALWSNGYKVGPGRNLPNAVLLIKK